MIYARDKELKTIIYFKATKETSWFKDILIDKINEIKKRRSINVELIFEIESSENYKLLKKRIKNNEVKCKTIIFCDLTIKKKTLSKLINFKKICGLYDINLVIVTKGQYDLFIKNIFKNI